MQRDLSKTLQTDSSGSPSHKPKVADVVVLVTDVVVVLDTDVVVLVTVEVASHMPHMTGQYSCRPALNASKKRLADLAGVQYCNKKRLQPVPSGSPEHTKGVAVGFAVGAAVGAVTASESLPNLERRRTPKGVGRTTSVCAVGCIAIVNVPGM